MTRSYTRRQYPGAQIINVRTQLDIIEDWTPEDKPIHCSNCFHCKVSRNGVGLEAHCAMGYGSSKPLSTIIRAANPRGFKDANKCEDFRSMD